MSTIPPQEELAAMENPPAAAAPPQAAPTTTTSVPAHVASSPTTTTLPITSTDKTANLVAASNAGPKLDAGAIVGVATTATDPNDAAVKAQVAQSVQEATKMADKLNGTSVDFQHTFWNEQASPALKSLLASAGYKPPAANAVAPANQSSGGLFGWLHPLWHHVVHALDDVRSIGHSAIDYTVLDPLKIAAQPFNMAGNAVSHVIRDMGYQGQEEDMQNARTGNPGSANGWYEAFNPVDLARNWDSTSNGASTFQPEVIAYVQRKMGITGTELELAKMMASGAGMQTALQGIKPAQRAQAAQDIMSIPSFADAVKLLSDSHLSLGQIVFGGLSAEQTHALYPDVSTGLATGYALAGQSVAAAETAALLAGDPAAGGTEALGEAGGLLDGVGALKDANTIRGAAGITAGGLMVSRSAISAAEGKTVDATSQISPFGVKINPMSGILDGLVSWFGNPVFMGVAARGAYNATAHSISLLDAQGNAIDVEAKFLNQNRERAWAQKLVTNVVKPWDASHGEFAPSPNVAALEDAGISVNAEWVELLKHYYPKLLEAAKDPNVDSVPRAVGQMLGEQMGIINILRGRLGGALRDAQTIPHLSIPQEAIDKLKGVAQEAFQGKRFNPDAMSYRELSVDAFGDQVTGDGMAMAEATDQKLGRPARFLRRVANLTPEDSVIRYSDPNRIKMFRQYARFALPEDRVDQLTNAYAAIDPADTGLQFSAMKGMMQEVLHAANVDRTPLGEQWMKDTLAAMDNSAAEGEMYADVRNPNGPREAKAIFPTELADAVSMPRYQDFYRFAKKSWFMEQLDMRLNSDLFDTFMSKYWKAAMLLRSGFALRFAGEEVLSHILRNGASSYFKGRIAASLYDTANPTLEAMRAAKAAVADQVDKELAAEHGNLAAINETDTARAYQAIASHVPEEVLKAVKTPEELKASIQAFSAMNLLRRAGVAYVGDDVLRAAQNLAQRGVLDSAFDDHIDAIRGHGTTYFGDIPKSGDEKALIKGADGNPISFRPTGKFHSFAKDDPHTLDTWSYRLGGIKGSEVGKQIARAHAFGGVEGQMQVAKDWIEGTSYKNRVESAAETWRNAMESGDEIKIAAAQDKLNAARANLAKHEALIKKFEVNFQTQDGATITSGATREEIVSDWAKAMVNKVNRLTFTSEGQEFDKEGERIPLTGDPQPILLPDTISPKKPYQLRTGDVGRNIDEVPDEELAYYDVPEGHVRLFKSINTVEAKEVVDKPGIGKAWSPNYEAAANQAGEFGVIYKMDVPVENVKTQYTFHGAEGVNRDEYLAEIQKAQHAGMKGSGKATVNRGYFESGDMKFTDTDTPTRRTLIGEIGRGVVPNNAELAAIDPIHRPDYLSAPEMMQAEKPGKIENLINKGMRQMVGRPANYISRAPIYTANYTNALIDTEKQLVARGIPDASGDLAHDVAMERGFNETIPYIHNPASKSQMSIIVRNMAPFWFAQEQFYKRWARLFGTYPEAWYKLQLTMNGLRSVGFVTKDQYGKDSFVYPGTQAVLGFLAKVMGGSIPVGVGFTGEISSLNPTLTTGGAPIPALGPVVMIPLDLAGVAMAHFGSPFLANVAHGASGPNAPQFNKDGQWVINTLEQITPSLVNRFATWAQSEADGTPENISDPLFMSLQIMAAQQLEASGHGLSTADSKNPVKRQQYFDRVANWAKSLLLTRALFGFFAPATPEFEIADNGLGAQWQALLATMPYDEAQTAFIKAHPNATAEMIFDSTTSGPSGSGTNVPATTQAIDYIQGNAGFFQSYPQIAPYAIPAKASAGLFNGDAYQQEKAMDLRTGRPLYTPELADSWYGEMKYAEGANIYYPMETLFQAAGSSTQADASAAQATLNITQAQALSQLTLNGQTPKQAWTAWAAKFKDTHPIFADEQTIVAGESTARRTSIVNELQNAISAGALPAGDWATQTERLMAAFDLVQSAYSSVQGTATATQNKEAFLTWGTAFVNLHPDVAPLWNAVISKAVPG